jgi:hypothetical protein
VHQQPIEELRLLEFDLRSWKQINQQLPPPQLIEELRQAYLPKAYLPKPVELRSCGSFMEGSSRLAVVIVGKKALKS